MNATQSVRCEGQHLMDCRQHDDLQPCPGVGVLLVESEGRQLLICATCAVTYPHCYHVPLDEQDETL